MAHFAQLDENGVVTQVIVISNNELLDENGNESEQKGITFCQSLFPDTNWKQTSYNGNFRKNYAGIGFTYDQTRDAFIPSQPFPSWTLNEATLQWEPPVPMPEDNSGPYIWNESQTDWESIASGQPAVGV
jgi:hypothetical protein